MPLPRVKASYDATTNKHTEASDVATNLSRPKICVITEALPAIIHYLTKNKRKKGGGCLQVLLNDAVKRKKKHTHKLHSRNLICHTSCNVRTED